MVKWILIVAALVVAAASASANHQKHNHHSHGGNSHQASHGHGHGKSHGHGHGGGCFGTAGDFDLYVFQQSWSAEFCAGTHFPGCLNPSPFMQTNLTIHGLWPQYNVSREGHGWPQCCDTKYGKNVDTKVVKELSTQLDKYWPDEKGKTDQFWDHEWSKHGTCSGLTQENYFKSGIQVDQMISTPEIIYDSVGKDVDAGKLQAAYTPDGETVNDDALWVALACRGNKLKSVTTCWDPQLKRTTCPQALKHSCPTNGKIHIPSFKDNSSHKKMVKREAKKGVRMY